MIQHLYHPEYALIKNLPNSHFLWVYTLGAEVKKLIFQWYCSFYQQG